MSKMSSLLLQLPFVTVHLSVTLVPAVRPVTVLVGEPGVVIVTAVPLTMLHDPVPTPGVLPARVNVSLLHWLMSAPAAAVVAGR